MKKINILKKVGCSVLILTIPAFASMQNQATITDIKESLYYLIKDYGNVKNRLKNLEANVSSQKINEETLKQKIEDLNGKLQSQKTAIDKISLQIEEFEIEPKRDNEDDRIIEMFIKNNAKKDY